MLAQYKFRSFRIKTLTLIYLATIFLCSQLFAQSGWFPLNSGTTAVCNGVFFIDANTGFINLTNDGNGHYLKTTNAGSSWSELTIPVPATDWQRAVFFTDVNTGYIASGDIDTGNVYKTINGGANWTSLTLPVYREFCSMFFLNSNTGYVSGWQVILKTTNAGSTWVNQSIPSGVEWLWSIFFTDANTGYAAGGTNSITERYILKTTNGGSNWQTVYSYPDGLFFGISFIDANTGAVVGGRYFSPGSYICRTTNGGINWTETFTNSVNLNYLWGVMYVSPSIGYASGGNPGSNGSIILKTTNAGLNWYPQTTNTSYGLLGNYFTSINTGYVVGFGGHILKTTVGGGNFVGIETAGQEIPDKFHLFQNYPNPFNPATNIRFDISGNSFVSLKIYDVMGREVTSLVNEQLSSGAYEVDWNASNYPSGVYYYRMIAGEYSETKKMILVK
jgi:photosystem II stability/assembly factor-like uncharacterized protein